MKSKSDTLYVVNSRSFWGSRDICNFTWNHAEIDQIFTQNHHKIEEIDIHRFHVSLTQIVKSDVKLDQKMWNSNFYTLGKSGNFWEFLIFRNGFSDSGKPDWELWLESNWNWFEICSIWFENLWLDRKCLKNSKEINSKFVRFNSTPPLLRAAWISNKYFHYSRP